LSVKSGIGRLTLEGPEVPGCYERTCSWTRTCSCVKTSQIFMFQKVEHLNRKQKLWK